MQSRLVLEMLWGMQWVEGRDIFERVNQTYYDRRIRELRESGWDIETSGTKYRLRSHEKAKGQVRTYPSTQQKREVYIRDKGTCQICGSKDEHIQYDHKIPLERAGTTEVTNLQLLCRTCNVEKRGVCKKCQLPTCDGCAYAYPEIYSLRIMLALDKGLLQKIQLEASQRGVPPTVIISEILSERFP